MKENYHLTILNQPWGKPLNLLPLNDTVNSYLCDIEKVQKIAIVAKAFCRHFVLHTLSSVPKDTLSIHSVTEVSSGEE